MSDIPLEELRRHFYVVDDCRLIRKDGSRRSDRSGKETGSTNPMGYKNGYLGRRQFFVHRAIFALIHGYYPKSIDHIDGNRSNNHISNLRECTQSQNMCNAKIRKGRQGMKGVWWDKSRGKWCARINVNGQAINLGRHDDREFARFVRECAAEKYHGEFARDA